MTQYGELLSCAAVTCLQPCDHLRSTWGGLCVCTLCVCLKQCGVLHMGHHHPRLCPAPRLVTVALCVAVLVLLVALALLCLLRLRVSWRGMGKTPVVMYCWCALSGANPQRRIAAGCRCKCSLPVHGLVCGCMAFPACSPFLCANMHPLAGGGWSIL
jgi:hypothetical protein